MKNVTRFLIKNKEKLRLVLFIAYCLFIIYYTVLSRTAGDKHTTDLRLMWAYREMLTGHPEWKEDVGYNLLNILFFVTFGLCFPEGVKPPSVFKNRRWLLILSIGMLFSILIETTQYLTCRGLCEIDDVLCNGFGSLIGYWLFIVLNRVWANTKRLINNDFEELDE